MTINNLIVDGAEVVGDVFVGGDESPILNKSDMSLNSNFTKYYYSKLDKVDKDKNFLVSYQRAYDIDGNINTTKCFYSYDSFDEFYEVQQKQTLICKDNCRWEEIIKENSPLVECYDLDAKINDKNERNINMFKLYNEIGEDAMIDQFKYYRKQFIELHYPLYDIPNEVFAISSACSNKKFSIHIAVRNNHFFENSNKLKIFMNNFDKFLFHDGKFVLDLSIYNKNHAMRMIGNTKYGQKRFLKKHRSCSNLDDKLFLFSYVQPEDKVYTIYDCVKPDLKIIDKTLSFDKSTDYNNMTILLPHIKDNITYSNWSLIGQVIYNISEASNDGLEQFIEWSKKDYDDFDEDKVINHWNNYKITDHNFGVLVNQVKKDNPEILKDFYKHSRKFIFIDEDIIECGKKIIEDFTHNNLAKIYAEYSKGEIFYTSAYGWIIFDKTTKIWSYNNDKNSLIFPISSFFCNVIKEYSIHVFNENNKELTSDENKKFQKFMKEISKIKTNVGNSSFISGVISQIQSILTKHNDFLDNFDNKPNLFAFSDGKCIDLLNNGNVRDIVKEDYIMTTCGYSYPVRDENYIKKWEEILNSLSDDPQQIKTIKSLLSLSLWGENKNEVFCQLTGTGGNGKGLLDTGSKTVYGNYYKPINSNQLTEYEKDNQRANSELASCRFARFVMASEPKDENYNGKATTLKVASIKKWTGRDLITTRFLHKDSFSFTAKFVLMMQLNDLLDLSTNDEGIKRRMKVIELPFKFVKNEGQVLNENEKYRDETLKDTIKQDKYRDALFFILLDTWLETNGIFYESEKVKNTTNEFFTNQNPVKFWFDEKYEIDLYSKINSTELYNNYKKDVYDSSISMTTFGRLMKEFCKSKKSTGGKIVYLCKRKIIQHDDDDIHPLLL